VPKKGKPRIDAAFVGVARLELTTSSSRTKHSTGLSYTPKIQCLHRIEHRIKLLVLQNLRKKKVPQMFLNNRYRTSVSAAVITVRPFKRTAQM
jgi:hypothetical protein